MAGRKIIFIEFNELCPDLLKKWMAEGRLPNFKRFYDASQVFTGTADVSDVTLMEPWIQWYSLHTGLSYDQHKVFHLTDGPKANHKDIWHVLQDAGYTVGNFAGMNAPNVSGPGSFYLPDPWCNSELPYPEELNAYQRVVLAKVQENSNNSATLGKKAYADFLRFLVTHGLRPQSALAVVKQLAEEVVSKDVSWKRAALLDLLQVDLFLHYWNKSKPDFASFFINSTAHFQHAYFHLLHPESFDLPEEAMDDPAHRDAVLFGYQQMDRLLDDFLALERHGVMLALSTALSQQPNPQAGKKFYRPRDIDGLMRLFGVNPARLLPVMAQQYSAEFVDKEAADAARARMERLTYQGRPVLQFGPSPEGKLFFDNPIRTDVAGDAVVELDGRDIPYYELFYKIPHMKSGMHHPDSVLWFKTGRHAVHPGRTPILDVFPTLLEYYGVPVPRESDLVRAGSSFLGRLGIEPYSAVEPLQRVAAE